MTKEQEIEELGFLISKYNHNSEVAWKEDLSTAKFIINAGYHLTTPTPDKVEAVANFKQDLADALIYQFGTNEVVTILDIFDDVIRNYQTLISPAVPPITDPSGIECYTLTCLKCGESYSSKEAFPQVQMCEKCYEPPELPVPTKPYKTCQRSVMQQWSCFDCLLYHDCEAPNKEAQFRNNASA
jgi:hypothetical protein